MSHSPVITVLDWGRTEVADHGTFKDVKLWPGGARAWDWGETGTDHSPGIQPADVEELLEAGAEVVILSRGQQQRLNVTDDAIVAIEEHGASPEILPTPAAVQRYNELARDGHAVAALIHSTC